MCLYLLGPLSNDRYAEIDDDVDVEQCSDSETVRNTRQNAQTTLASPPPSCASDDERSTPEHISVSKLSLSRSSDLCHGRFNFIYPLFVSQLFAFFDFFFTDQITFD